MKAFLVNAYKQIKGCAGGGLHMLFYISVNWKMNMDLIMTEIALLYCGDGTLIISVCFGLIQKKNSKLFIPYDLSRRS